MPAIKDVLKGRVEIAREVKPVPHGHEAVFGTQYNTHRQFQTLQGVNNIAGIAQVQVPRLPHECRNTSMFRVMRPMRGEGLARLGTSRMRSAQKHVKGKFKG